MISIPSELPFPIGQKLLSLCQRTAAKIEREDTQVIGILCGEPGDGKSVTAQHMAHVIAPGKLTLDKICMNKTEFVQAVLTSREEVVIADEGLAIFFSRGAMTKEGRLIAELMGEIRQRHLCVLICIWDLLAVDSLILNKAHFVIAVSESHIIKNKKQETIKGNIKIYPNFPRNQLAVRYTMWLKRKKANPFIIEKPPHPWGKEAGGMYGETHKPAWYAVDPDDYKAKKDSILLKFRKGMERKPRNAHVDYANMDKLIKAGVSLRKIAELLDVGYDTAKKRKQAYHNKPRHKKGMRCKISRG